MGYYFICDVCDKFFKTKSKKKHLNSQYHKSLSMSLINRYTVKNPDFFQIQKVLKNYVFDFNKKIAF